VCPPPGSASETNHRTVRRSIVFLQLALVELLGYARDAFNFTEKQVDAWTRLADVIADVMEKRVDSLK